MDRFSRFKSDPILFRTSKDTTISSGTVILHTESSCGWGGQEVRTLKEAEGMRARGHEIIFAVTCGAILGKRAREAGFSVYELPFQKKWALYVMPALVRIMKKHKVSLVNTHSSVDAWLAGIAARLLSKKVVRTRYVGAAIRKGLNSQILYRFLTDFIVTTSSKIVPLIAKQAHKNSKNVRCIPTGVDADRVKATPEGISFWKRKLGIQPEDLLIGTVCGRGKFQAISDFLFAAHQLKSNPRLKWVVIGGGYFQESLSLASQLGLKDKVIFTGPIDSPYDVLGACDVFVFLGTANEGISQVSLEAAYLSKPLIVTHVGGASEVCVPGKTGILVPPGSAQAVAQAVQEMEDPLLRQQYGEEARKLVLKKFLFSQTLEGMEKVYHTLTL